MLRLSTAALLVLCAALGVVSSGCAVDRPASALVQDLAGYLALPDDEAMAKAAPALTKKWQSQRVRWSALATAVLCVDKAPNDLTCAMNPFPRGGADAAAAAALGGLFPLFHLDSAARDALHTACAGRGSCVVDVEGTLSTLTLDPSLPLAIELTGITIHGGRAPRADEPWSRPALVVPPQARKSLAVPPANPTPLSLTVDVKVF